MGFGIDLGGIEAYFRGGEAALQAAVVHLYASITTRRQRRESANSKWIEMSSLKDETGKQRAHGPCICLVRRTQRLGLYQHGSNSSASWVLTLKNWYSTYRIHIISTVESSGIVLSAEIPDIISAHNSTMGSTLSRLTKSYRSLASHTHPEPLPECPLRPFRDCPKHESH